MEHAVGDTEDGNEKCARKAIDSDLSSSAAHWVKQLAGAPLVLELPTDRGRSVSGEFTHGIERFELPSAACQALRALQSQVGVSLKTLVLTSFYAWLFRYTHQKDLLVGLNSVRRAAASPNSIGVEERVLRLRLSGRPTFLELLEQVSAAVDEAMRHAAIPLALLIENLQPPLDAGRSPIFQAAFWMGDDRALEPGAEPRLGEAMDAHAVRAARRGVELSLSLDGSPNGLAGHVTYRADLIERETAQRWLRHWQSLLASACRAPERPISRLDVLSESERRMLLVTWNDTHADYPRDALVHDLFRQRAEKSPDAVALEFGEARWTYRELERRSNQLAHYLRKRGVGPETLVGASVARSFDLIVGLLGVLKAGGAYVPMDPSYPRERLLYLAKESGAKVILTQRPVAARLSGPDLGAGVELVCLDDEWSAIALESELPPEVDLTAENLAYVIFTSGSTGLPKGVAVPHRGVVRLALAKNYIRVQEDDVFLQLGPVAFDASTFEIWAPLLHGARLAIAPPDLERPLDELGPVLRHHRVTTLFLATPLFHQMVDARADQLQGLRYLVAGGDAMSARHAQRATRMIPGCQVINGYGPTENTTFTTCEPFKDDGRGLVPIGRPIDNTTVYILDEEFQPVPIGVVGEVFTGGDGLARCYLGRRALTAEKFVPDAFGKEPGARLYRVGDLARYVADGRIEFLGRSDFQVKIKGYRMELGEVEAAVGSHPMVGEHVVVVRTNDAGEKRLVAYVVQQRAGECSASQLRAHVAQKLPEHMLPSAFVFMDSFPLTPNGKVDRKALPAPEGRLD